MTDPEAGPRTPVASDVSVDPGELLAFAKFLDQMAAEVSRIERSLNPYAANPRQADLGHYTESDGALARHHRVAKAAHDNAQSLHKRAGELTDATNELAHQYRDLGELNSALAGQVRAVLAKG